MADDLSTPLGKKKRPKLTLKLGFNAYEWPIGRMLFGIVGLFIATFVIRIMLVDDPTGGQPVVEVPITSTLNSNTIAQQVSSETANNLTIVSDTAETPQIIQISNNDLTPQTEPNQRNDFGVLPELMEQTQHGPIPRVGPDGKSPFNAYARPSIGPEIAASTPIIAIIVTGMGLSESGTLDAITNLPDNITLAFAPYSRTLERTTAAARAGGHEIILEIPMEPFDYPNSDPGPHTLLTGNTARANLDRLFWLMARVGGYVGVINNMGARFTSSATDLGPFMEELGSRGIGYLDDGSSNRSLTNQLARANQVPYARAQLILDTTPSRAAILAQLQKLEELAQQEGSAVGVISALPVSITTLATWAAQLGDKGIELVPASVLMRI